MNQDFADNLKPKSFWERPEGKTGMLFAAGLALGGGYLLYKALPILISLATNTLYLAVILMVLAALVYMILDPKMRNLVFYVYKSIMRFITGLFVQIDPIGVLNTYVEDLQSNLGKMDKQIGALRGQMRKLKDLINQNKLQINSNLQMANKAKETDKQGMMILKTRKAGRLQQSNVRYEDLYRKMEVLYRVLSKMYENSEILLEDIKDQVEMKKQERSMIRASHSAMKSAINIISGNSDKRQMFDQALEAIADDVGMKIGEMERFMEMSGNFMDSIDLQNGVFEEEGMKMLEKWEKEGVSMLLGNDKNLLVQQGNSSSAEVDLDAPIQHGKSSGNQYSKLFDF
ncbi:MAG: hypothetical protein IPL35_14390 [Sphingobacteriales bacterium]|nr:hypothetical protein [Sphingobacteriales bacterium]